MIYAIAGIVLLIGLVFAAQWFAQANPKTLVTVARWTAIGALGAGTAFLALTGRMALAVMLATGVLPLLRRWGVLGGAGAGRPSGGRASEVATDFVRMRLDHDSGLMEGDVLRGRFRGRKLGDLSRADLAALLDECRTADVEGARLVEAYLDKTFPDWRDDTGEGRESGRAAPRPGAMDRDEAMKVLGVGPGASADDIRQAHRRLMQKVHPDLGGSDYLAAKLNEAKDVLLGE
jgi:hypothetical protein